MARRTGTPRKATIVLVAMLVGLTLSVYPERIHACSCAGPRNQESMVFGSEVIFVGRLVDARQYSQHSQFGYYSIFVDFKFEVEAVWKGDVPQIAYMSANRGDGAACADLPYSTDFVIGVRYLVYTYESMEFSLCSVVIREGGDGYVDLLFAERMGTFEEQVANLGPAKGLSGPGTDEWPPTPTPYPLAPLPEPPTPTRSPYSTTLLQNTPTSAPMPKPFMPTPTPYSTRLLPNTPTSTPGSEPPTPTPSPYSTALLPNTPTSAPGSESPTPSPASTALPQDTPTSPPAVSTPAPSAGGCGRGNSMDLAVFGMLAGLAWCASRRRNF